MNASNTLLLLPFLMMGLLGSPHCLGMCGGIVSAFGIATKRAYFMPIYHFGRILAYVLLGVGASFIGTAILSDYAHNHVARVMLGVALTLSGLMMLGLPLGALERAGFTLWQKMQPLRARVLPIDSTPKALLAGLLWGFLPCGLVYGALLTAISTPFGVGVLGMAVFGVGTLPALLGTGWLFSYINPNKWRTISGVILVLSGIAIGVIPFIMPHHHASHDNPAPHSTHHAPNAHTHHH